jgi:hypothetical protein
VGVGRARGNFYQSMSGFALSKIVRDYFISGDLVTNKQLRSYKLICFLLRSTKLVSKYFFIKQNYQGVTLRVRLAN